MSSKSGSLSINSENIFPVIKKWLYSDHDIFIRELVSNGCDAITKLKKLDGVGEATLPEGYQPKVTVRVNPEAKTITFIDNGIGMTFDEVNEYINQIAFSGAADFLEKYKDKTSDDQIIGHFGLGFYSAFMVADRVTIDTLSCQEGAKAVHWESDEGVEFEMSDGDRTEVGTEITLFLNDESEQFSSEFGAREVLNKYCSFMPFEIYLEVEGKEPEMEEVEVDAADGSVDEEGKPKKETIKVPKAPTPVNDIHPLWQKKPNECTEEEYKEFYRKVFLDYKEPLFWIHLNMDYPFNLKGILYFPKINMEYESAEGTIKLYNNQVFVADNIKEVIPEFLMLLKGAIDCPDLPLNVSRSALQNDGFVKKISDYITKKVADKLSGMCKTDRESYEHYWDDIAPFIKYGCLKDSKFDDKMKDFMLYKDIDGKYLTLSDCLEANKEHHENTIFYVTDAKEQAQYINFFRQEGIDAVILNTPIDNPYMTHVEQKNKDLHFVGIDAGLDNAFKAEDETDEETKKANADKLTNLFRTALSNDKLDVKVEKLKNESVASMITVDEQSRRMQDMMKMYGMADMSGMGGAAETLILNIAHPLVHALLTAEEGEQTTMFCEQLYDLAKLSHGSLSSERMTAFIERTNKIMMMLGK